MPRQIASSGTPRAIAAPDQRQGGGVARRVGGAGRRRGRPAIVVRLDVGRAAGEQQAVEPVQKVVGIDPVADRRDQERQAAGAVDHAVDVLGADLMEAEAVTGNQAGRERR